MPLCEQSRRQGLPPLASRGELRWAIHPGDLLEKRPGGYRICGRVSDFINVAGRKVNPAEIEQVLGSIPEVDSVVVVGLPVGSEGRRLGPVT